MVKEDKKETLKKGFCFICQSPCKETSYCHSECAFAYDDAKRSFISFVNRDKRIKSDNIRALILNEFYHFYLKRGRKA